MTPICLQDAASLPDAVLDVLAEAEGEPRLRRTYHAWQLQDPERARELAEAVAAALGQRGAFTDAAVLSFFAHLPRAPGGAAVVHFVAEHPEHFGDDHPALEDALHVALSIGGDFAPLDERVAAAARAEVLAGRGERLLYPLWRKDAAWMHAHLDALLGAYPGRVDASFYGLVDRGETPEDALQRVVAAADASGRRRLVEQIDWTTIFDPEVRDRLCEMLEADGDGSGCPGGGVRS